jgi:hypothetical protein
MPDYTVSKHRRGSLGFWDLRDPQWYLADFLASGSTQDTVRLLATNLHGKWMPKGDFNVDTKQVRLTGNGAEPFLRIRQLCSYS